MTKEEFKAWAERRGIQIQAITKESDAGFIQTNLSWTFRFGGLGYKDLAEKVEAFEDRMFHHTVKDSNNATP